MTFLTAGSFMKTVDCQPILLRKLSALWRFWNNRNQRFSLILRILKEPEPPVFKLIQITAQRGHWHRHYTQRRVWFFWKQEFEERILQTRWWWWSSPACVGKQTTQNSWDLHYTWQTNCRRRFLSWSVQWVVSRRSMLQASLTLNRRPWFEVLERIQFVHQKCVHETLSRFVCFLFFLFSAVNLCIMSTTCVSNTKDLFQSVIDILTASLYTWLRKRKLNLYDLVLNTDSISIVIGIIWAREMIHREDGSKCILCWIQIWLRVSSTWLRATEMAQEEVQFVSCGVARIFGCERDRH